MVDTQLIQQLESRDPEQRKQAVKDLAKTKDRAALPYLASVFRNDRDSEVRELARKAGVYINKHTIGEPDIYDDEEEENDNGYQPLYVTNDDVDAAPASSGAAQVPEVEVTDLDRERARGLVQQALDIHMRGNNSRAIRYMQQAFKKDPTLMRDSYTKGLAATIVGSSADNAVQIILQGEKRKTGGKLTDEADPSWGDAFIDLAIYAAVLIGLSIFGQLVVVEALRTAVVNSPSAASYGFDPTMFDMLLSSGSVIAIVAGSLGAGVGSVLQLLIQYFIIHMIAVTIMGGDGSMPRLIRYCTLFLTFLNPAMLVVFVGLTFLGLSLPESSLGIIVIASVGVFLGISFWFSRLIGKAYRFGTGQGCAALVLSYVLPVLILCGCNFLITLAAFQSL